MIRFAPLTPEALARVTADERSGMAPWPEEWVAGAVTHPCEVLLRGDQPIAAAGLLPYWRGSAAAWAMVSRHATRREVVAMVRRCRQVMDELQRSPDWARIEMRTLAEAPWARSFAAALGMQQEGYLRRWDQQGRDYLMYARVVEWS